MRSSLSTKSDHPVHIVCDSSAVAGNMFPTSSTPYELPLGLPTEHLPLGALILDPRRPLGNSSRHHLIGINQCPSRSGTTRNFNSIPKETILYRIREALGMKRKVLKATFHAKTLELSEFADLEAWHDWFDSESNAEGRKSIVKTMEGEHSHHGFLLWRVWRAEGTVLHSRTPTHKCQVEYRANEGCVVAFSVTKVVLVEGELFLHREQNIRAEVPGSNLVANAVPIL